MQVNSLTFNKLFAALAEGRNIARQTGNVGYAYTAVFVLGGALIIGSLLVRGWTPFVISAAGAFMLLGPAIMAGYFGIARAFEAGRRPLTQDVRIGFAEANQAIWVLALVCALLFMIFLTDAAILYAYMLGDAPVWLVHWLSPNENIVRFVIWSSISGAVVALMLFAVSAFSVPLLCEQRANLVEAVVLSVRIVLGNFAVLLVWAVLLAVLVIGSILFLPLLLWTLPWLAYASWILYRAALPRGIDVAGRG